MVNTDVNNIYRQLTTITGVSLPSLAILDQSCSSLPSQSAASSGSSQEQVALTERRTTGKKEVKVPVKILFPAGFWLPRILGANPGVETEWKVRLLLPQLHRQQTAEGKGRRCQPIC